MFLEVEARSRRQKTGQSDVLKWKDLVCHCWLWRQEGWEETQSKEYGWHLEAEKGREADSPPEPQERKTQPVNTLILAQWEPSLILCGKWWVLVLRILDLFPSKDVFFVYSYVPIISDPSHSCYIATLWYESLLFPLPFLSFLAHSKKGSQFDFHISNFIFYRVNWI